MVGQVEQEPAIQRCKIEPDAGPFGESGFQTVIHGLVVGGYSEHVRLVLTTALS